MITTIYTCNRCKREINEDMFYVEGITLHQRSHTFHLCGSCRLDLLAWIKVGVICHSCEKPISEEGEVDDVK